MDLSIIIKTIKSLSTYSGLMATMAAICSAVIAVLTFYNNKKLGENKLRSDLYIAINQLIIFVNCVIVRFGYHDYTRENLIELYRSIPDPDKKIIDENNPCFFNDKYDLSVILKISTFLSQYSAWKSFNIITPEERFMYLSLLYESQNCAIEALMRIKDVYKNDEKVSELMKSISPEAQYDNKSVQSLLDKIFYESKNKMDKSRYICGNLTAIFTNPDIIHRLSADLIIDDNRRINPDVEITFTLLRQTIVAKLAIFFFNDIERVGGIGNSRYSRIYHLLFDYQLETDSLQNNIVYFKKDNREDEVMNKTELIALLEAIYQL